MCSSQKSHGHRVALTRERDRQVESRIVSKFDKSPFRFLQRDPAVRAPRSQTIAGLRKRLRISLASPDAGTCHRVSSSGLPARAKPRFHPDPAHRLPQTSTKSLPLTCSRLVHGFKILTAWPLPHWQSTPCLREYRQRVAGTLVENHGASSSAIDRPYQCRSLIVAGME